MCTHTRVGAESPGGSWRGALAALGVAGDHAPSEKGGSPTRACPPRRRSSVSTSHLSDRYKAESSRMNLAGNRAEKGPELLQAAAAREPAGAGHPRQVPSPQDTSTEPSLASVSLSAQWGKRRRRPRFVVLQVLPAPLPHLGLTAARGRGAVLFSPPACTVLQSPYFNGNITQVPLIYLKSWQ